MIELIVVIVILGVLAATALPKFIDVQTNAEASALKGVAGSMASAMGVNYGGCLVAGNVVTAGKCVKVRDCADVSTLLQGAALPTGYTVTAAAIAAIGTTVSCTVTQTSTTNTATFEGIGAGT